MYDTEADSSQCLKNSWQHLWPWWQFEQLVTVPSDGGRPLLAHACPMVPLQL